MYSFGYHIVCCITLALLAKGTMGQYAPRDVPVGAASLAFVFDTTGSMFDDLVQVIAGAKKILNTTLARREKPLYNYVLVPFHDPDIGPVLVTTDPSEFQEVLGSLYVQGGQDCPEMSIGAISEALDVTLPNSFIYVFTDASAKDYQLTDVVLAQIQQKHSQIVFVLTGDCGDPTHEGFRAYETVASTSSGQVFLLHKNQVNKILEFVEVAVQARKVNLMSVDVQDSGTRTFDVPIDSNIQEFTVSVSGDDPLIQLVNPSGQIVDVYRGLHELLSLSTAKVVNVKDPEDGVWELSIVSSSPHTIRVTGLSSTDFVAGFARKLDGKTELRPLGGVPSYVMINASDLDPPGGFTNLELVNIYGEILEFHDLRRNEINPNFYTTESPFVPPVGFFYIKLTGIDKKNYNLVRLTPTALSSRPPPKPYVYLPPITRGFYDTTATILCAVQSPIPFSVRWHKDGVPIGDEQFFGESSNVLLEIPYATRQVEGRYYCNATNIAGYNATVTFLDITEPPPDIQPMWNVTVLPGEHTRMDCIVHSTVEYNITWYHPKSQDFIKTGKKYSVFNNGSLLIHNVGMDDEGRYVCVASNEGGMTEGLVHLRVKVQPKAQIQPETKNFKNGETVNLTCTAEGYPEPTFYWLRDDQVLLPTERIRISGQHLSIGNMFSGDQGAYQCLAENSAGEDIVTALLTYIEPPIITEAVQKVLVASGDNATLVCLANGIPPPKITWFRGDVQLRPLSYVDITETGRLTIIGTQTQDAGIYTCVATNEAGSDSTMVELEVGSDPRILIGPDSEGIDIGTNATLECVAEGSPKPKIYWKDNDGNMIILGGRFLQLQSGSLFIMNLQPEDEGKYTCVAQNQFGIQEMTSFVTVTGILRPVIAFTNPYIEIKQGEELELHCVLLQGNPQPRVQWLRYSSRIKEDEHVNRTGPGHIFISNIQQKHEGEYVCLASNVAGNSTFGVTVDVQVPPNLETDVEGNTQTEFTVFEGESITLPCSTDGDPKPVIMWFKDGVEISLADPAYFITESGGLEIFGAEAQNAGSYMCVASNVAGEISKTVKLFVEVSPTIQGLLEEEKTVIKGETVLMSCVAEGTPKPEMSWRRNFIPFTHENGRFTENDRGLTISSVTLEDKAIYECVATNVAGEATKVITLIVQIPPTISEEGETEIIVHKGDLVTLNCDSEGEPEPLVTWTKNAQILDLFSNVHLLVDTKGSLTITDAKETDDGLYICTADNGAGTAKKEFSVTVHASPTLPDGLRDKMDIIEGNDVILECPATGKPKPVVQWFKNDREIRASEPGVNFLSDGSLELLSTEARDSGAYRCVATNVAGEIDHDVNLKVLIPPKVIGGQRGDIPIPESHTVVVNQSLTLRCTVEADPPPVIQWKRNDRLITEDMFNSGALSVSEDGKELTIEHSEVEDSGKYSCVATNVAGQSEKNFVVEVHVPPFIDESTASLRNLSVIINNPLTIACPVIGVPLPQILWYKNGEYISPSLDPNIQLHGGGRRLEISGARISDAAGYRCVGKNIAGHTFKDYDVSVYIPPTIEESDIRGTFEVKENFPLTLVCHASGIPRPEITWYKRGLPVENGTRYLILNDGSHLQIPSAMLDDASIFTCKAENVAGAIEKKYDVNVLVEAFIPREDIDLTVDVVINRTMTLNCPAQGNPLPEITWYKNNIIIDSSARSRYEIVSEGRQLLVKNAALSDTATYSCEAINKAGKDRIDFNAEVLVPSKIQLPNVNTNPKVVVNSSLVLDCPATGTPPPVITWFKDNQEISGTSLPNVRILQGGRQIELTNIQTSDTGRYKCRASNTAGTSELNYNVNVQVPPSITRDVNTSPNVIVNNPVTIYCPAEGTPLPNIAWSKNGEPIVEDGVNYIIKSGGRELTIQSASVQDTGRYTCTASNEAGSSRKDYDLDVYVPPKIADTYDKLTKVIRGRSTVLSCPASGTPTPVIEWSHNGEQVAYSDKILALDGGRTLQFFDSQVKNSGNYRCLATNVAGRDYADMELMVLVPPSIDESNAVYTPKVIQNRTVLLECAVSGVPQPEVQWLVNDRPLAASDRISFHNQNTLVQILDSKVTDTSTYTCQATNEAGQLRKNFQLQIIVPPVIDQTVRRNFTVVEGGTINIDCPVSGIPLPSITWLKERTALTSFPYTDITLTNGNQRIIIRNAKLEDAVKYSCRAVNPAGRTTMDFYLRVYVRPVIEDTEDDEISALEGEMVTLECPVVGIPDPIIQWQKDNRVIELSHNSHIQILAGGQVLRLQGVSVTDAAQYKCHAENEAGWAEKLFQLQVLVAPRIIGSNRLQQMEVVLGNDLELTCQVQGVPTPDIVWIWQGSPIAQSSRFFQRSEGGQRLTVVDADLPQAGNFTCLAQNLAGLASLNYTVSVLVPPKITDDVKQVIGTLNEQATLPCEYGGVPAPTVSWMKNGEPFPLTSLRHQMIYGSLMFSRVRLEDEGRYQCVISNSVGNDTKFIDFLLQVPPTIVGDSTVRMNVIEGSSAFIPCEAEGRPEPTIQWNKGFFSQLRPGTRVLPNGTLWIQSVEGQDSGIYRCVASNVVDLASKTVRLRVLETPRIPIDETEYSVQSGDRLILPCRARGRPRPSIQWMKNGRPLDVRSSRYYLQRHRLVIAAAREEDAGNYTCTASNTAGDITVYRLVTVLVPPHIEEARRLITGYMGNVTTEVPCEVTGQPRPVITWYKDRQRLQPNPQKYIVKESGTLVIRNLELLDSGLYRCEAVNIAGNTSQEITIRVQVPPTITLLPQSQEVTVGGRIQLLCGASGIPTPVIRWTKNGSPIQDSQRGSGRSLVIIKGARVEDAGMYQCIAENPAGSDTAAAQILLSIPPQVSVPEGNAVVSIAEKVILTCSVGGDPRPKITWTKNGRPVELNERIQLMSNGSLVIYDATSSDAGDYKCVASNEAGTSEGVATLIVNEPPHFKIEPKNMTINQGDTLTMDCVAEGEPLPTISWQKSWEELVPEGRLSILPNNSLRILAIQVKDSGLYQCKASNREGITIVDAYVTVVVHGMYSKWSDWGPCSTSCGIGLQFRTRTCTDPAPVNGGRKCIGASLDSKTCLSGSCPVDGNWGNWQSWAECSSSCGAGQRTRIRECDNPPPQYDGEYCDGDYVEVGDCNQRPCPVNGVFSLWSDWGPCDVTCGMGFRERTRMCDNPVPKYGGNDCYGDTSQRQSCSANQCAVDGNWGSWTNWSPCSQSCGGGSRTKTRECNDPEPQFGGIYCVGRNRLVDYCNPEPCPVHGSWSPWESFGACSASCGGGIQKRFRTCTNPAPSQNGRRCPGSSEDVQQCNTESCLVPGFWSDWSDWSLCSVTCGEGSKERRRRCNTPRFGGMQCEGQSVQRDSCSLSPCTNFPTRAEGNLVGYINNIDLTDATINATIVTTVTGPTEIRGMLNNLPPAIGSHLRYLMDVLNPIYWATAHEINGAKNGFSLTRGNIVGEVQVNFATGEVLKMSQYSRGVDSNGVLQIDVIVFGNVPNITSSSQIQLVPFTEQYIQTGPETIYAQSSRLFRMDDTYIPYAWNRTVTYSDNFGLMPNLVQDLYSRDFKVLLDPTGTQMHFSLAASISPGDSNNMCPEGFHVDDTGTYCRDIDECLQLQPCSHHCHNSPGTYACSCPFGFMLQREGHTCEDINECNQNNGGCLSDQECINTLGSHHCAVICEAGFRRSLDDLRCDDIDECHETPEVCGQTCTNTRGSYHCSCSEGFRLLPNGRCTDVNECQEGQSRCSHICRNKIGTYKCACPAGLRLRDQFTCVDIDECAENSHRCYATQRCVNTQGSYQCEQQCQPGYQLNALRQCQDLDECRTNRHMCHATQQCINTDGSYTCTCQQGYRSEGPGRPCIDINECIERRALCSFHCRNIPGSFECVCAPGQILLADKKSCAGLEYLEPSQVLSVNDQHELSRTQTQYTRPCNQGYGHCRSRYRRTAYRRLKRGDKACLKGMRYIASQHKCIDINECRENLAGCQHNCTNSLGSFRCTCPNGYRVGRDGKRCVDIDECLELDIKCGEEEMCFNTKGDYRCISTPCPPRYHRSPFTGYCILECEDADTPCPPGASYADIIEFRNLALSSGIQAYQDLLRLIAYNQDNVQLKYTNFTILKNDEKVAFNIRLETGTGIIFPLEDLQETELYSITVRAQSYDHTRINIQYKTTFMVHIAVSAFPY